MTPCKRSMLVDASFVACVWITFLVILQLFELCGLGTSLANGAMGEDLNWIDLLRSGDGRTVAHNFWLMDSRNPLSPWFYIFSKSIILNFNNGLALLTYSVGLALALSTYLLLRSILYSISRKFAVLVGSAVALNSSNAYFDHIFWNFQAALCFSILSVAFYALHVRLGRPVWLYGLSLCLWCVAFQSYTLQSGAIIGIVFFIFYDRWRQLPPSPHTLLYIDLFKWMFGIRFLRSTSADILPYLLIYIVFILVWSTSAHNVAEFTYQPSPKRLVESIMSSVAHEDTYLMFQVWKASGHSTLYAITSLIFATMIMCIIQFCLPIENPVWPPIADIFLIVLVIMALATPTIVLETGGGAWPPGSRWRMIYQMTSPTIILALISISSVTHPPFRLVHRIVFVLCLAVWLTLSLAYNERQTELSQSELALRQSMASEMSLDISSQGSEKILFLIAIDDDFRWFATEAMRDVYLRTWFPGRNIEMRFMPSQKNIALSNPNRLQFTVAGVGWSEVDRLRSVGYGQSIFLHAHGHTVERMASVNRKFVIEHNGEWHLPDEVLILKK